jgi:hypothetical protein
LLLLLLLFIWHTCTIYIRHAAAAAGAAGWSCWHWSLCHQQLLLLLQHLLLLLLQGWFLRLPALHVCAPLQLLLGRAAGGQGCPCGGCGSRQVAHQPLHHLQHQQQQAHPR